MKDITYDGIRSYPQIIVDSLAQKLFETFSGSQINLSATGKLISEIANNSNPFGLAVFLASELLWQLPNLEPKMAKKIQSMKMEFIEKDPVFADLTMRKQVLVDSIDRFCQQDKVQTSYFQLELFDDLSAKKILDFVCQQTASNFQSSYKRKNWLFQPYTHPNKNIPGVWMSQNSTPYSDNALLELEKTKDIAFRQTYLVPAALTSVNKNIPVQ